MYKSEWHREFDEHSLTIQDWRYLVHNAQNRTLEKVQNVIYFGRIKGLPTLQHKVHLSKVPKQSW